MVIQDGIESSLKIVECYLYIKHSRLAEYSEIERIKKWSVHF